MINTLKPGDAYMMYILEKDDRQMANDFYTVENNCLMFIYISRKIMIIQTYA